MTSHKIGVNLRVSVSCDQGGRRYMEDTHSSQFIKCGGKEYEFAYFGIFDGHGGAEASKFARENLLDQITKYDCFWSNNDDDVMYAIKYGFLDTHYAMWRELERWPKTVKGLPNTSGTTASIAIIKNSKIYIGHVGDSGIVLGCNEMNQSSNCPETKIVAKCLTKDHKPESPEEKSRIEESGGAVMCKSGVQRVVWRRPNLNHKGPIRRSTHIDEIPFLAVARSLGDLWSYDYYNEKFVVSPEPDVSVHQIDPTKHKCLIFASDGLWNMVSPEESVTMVMCLEKHFEERIINDMSVSLSYWINPAERLVARALNKWQSRLMKADNTSAIVVYIDPLGPSKLTLLKKKRNEAFTKKHLNSSIPSTVLNCADLIVNNNSCISNSITENPMTLSTLSALRADCDKLIQSAAVSIAPIQTIGDQRNSLKTTSGAKDNENKFDPSQPETTGTNNLFQSKSPFECPSNTSSIIKNMHDLVGFSKFDALKEHVKPPSNGTLLQNVKTASDETFSEDVRSSSNETLSKKIKSSCSESLSKDGNSTSKEKSSNGKCLGILQTTRDNVHVTTRKGSSENFGHIFKFSKPFNSIEKVLNINCSIDSLIHKKDKKEAVSHGGKNTNNSNLYRANGHQLRSSTPAALAKKTCRTLQHAKDAARQAICLENSIFNHKRKRNRLTCLKRKSASNVVNEPVTKKLRKCEG